MQHSFTLLKKLYLNKTAEAYPLFWIIRGKNLVITRGKTGTRTLLKHSDFSCINTILTLNKLNQLVYEQEYDVHIIVREPEDRFKSGIFEDWYVYNAAGEYFINVSKNTTEEQWIKTVQTFINTSLQSFDRRDPTSNFHIGNWLHNVQTLIHNYSGKVKLWNFLDFSNLLLHLEIKETEKINAKTTKPFYSEFFKAYENVDGETKNTIQEFIEPDRQIWKELFT